MLKSITVENYRGFKGETTLELRPITVLLGRNSSGKSSLTRLIPLLQQSFERQSSSPVLWSSEAVDLGTISDVVTHGDVSATLRIGIKISAPHLYGFLSLARSSLTRLIDEQGTEIEYVIRLSADANRTRFKGIEIKIDDQLMAVDWNEKGIVTNIRIGEQNYPLEDVSYFVDTKAFFPDINRRIVGDEIARSSKAPIFYSPLRVALTSIIHGRTASEKIDLFARNFSFVPQKRAKEILKIFPNVVARKVDDENSKLISDLSMINDIPRIIAFLQFSIEPLFLSSAYIGPSRASGKRFDRIQELAVNRLDSSGENAAMYVYSLTQVERESFNDLLIRACGHIVEVEESGPGHVSIKIGRQGQLHFENIADVGFGFSQLVPVIAQLHAVRERAVDSEVAMSDDAIFAVEQPELHLHPAMQANLADLFVGSVQGGSAGNRNTIIVVETHSETFVAQLGMLVASGEISQENIALYFVSKDEMTGNSSLRHMSFDDQGIVNDWPVGFFAPG